MATAASHQITYYSDRKVRDYHSVPTPHGLSKNQTSLHKILHIISSIPPRTTSIQPPLNPLFCNTSKQNSDLLIVENRVAQGFDLNLSVAPPTLDAEDSQSLSSTYLAALGGAPMAQRNPSCECDFQSSEIQALTNFQVENSGIEECEKKEEDHGGSEMKCFDLLIEAAKMMEEEEEARKASELSGEFREETRKKKKCSSSSSISNRNKSTQKRDHQQHWREKYYGDLEEDVSSPVVRSKRGRTQVLPCKFRDSVLEPLSGHRSNALSSNQKSSLFEVKWNIRLKTAHVVRDPCN